MLNTKLGKFVQVHSVIQIQFKKIPFFLRKKERIKWEFFSSFKSSLSSFPKFIIEINMPQWFQVGKWKTKTITIFLVIIHPGRYNFLHLDWHPCSESITSQRLGRDGVEREIHASTARGKWQCKLRGGCRNRFWHENGEKFSGKCEPLEMSH